MEQRALLAFILSVAILVGYQAFFAPPPPMPEQAPLQNAPGTPPPAADPTVSPAAEALSALEPAAAAVPPVSPPPATTPRAAEATVEVVTKRYVAVLTSHGGRLKSYRLTRYRENPEPDAPPLDMVQAGAGSPGIGVSWVREVPPTANRFGGIDGPAVFVDDELHTEASASMDEPMRLSGAVDWAGYAEHYFLAAYYPRETTALRFLGATNGRLGEATLFADQAGGSVAYDLFIGPKKVWLLGELGHRLDEALDLGWFAFVARPLLELMLYLTKMTGNYGWSIILLTIGIRVVFYPVNQRQAMAMKAMQRIQPELKKIQEKYKDDREKLNKEMMETYRRHKVNPLAGCLPMLMQLPVFLGLYNALMQSIELRHAPFLGWITDLSQPDRLGSLAIPFVAPPGIPVMTLLMGASMVIQQRMMPAQGDPMQQRMMMFLPVVFTVMFINFPSGLVLYWFANNIMSIGQQYLTNRSKA